MEMNSRVEDGFHIESSNEKWILLSREFRNVIASSRLYAPPVFYRELYLWKEVFFLRWSALNLSSRINEYFKFVFLRYAPEDELYCYSIEMTRKMFGCLLVAIEAKNCLVEANQFFFLAHLVDWLCLTH